MKRSREPEDPELDVEDSSAEAAPRIIEPSLRPPVAKLSEPDPSAAAVSDDEGPTMRCSLPPHREILSFGTYEDYELHYSKSHMNRCLECSKNFPTNHFLDLHIQEFHDPLVVVRRERGERTFSCFVEGCDRQCRTHQKRRMHLVDKHMYPKNYFFAITKAGIDGRHSLLVNSGHGTRRSSASTTAKETHQRRSSHPDTDVKPGKDNSPLANAKKSDMDTGAVRQHVMAAASDGKEPGPEEPDEPKEPSDTEMENITGGMSALQFIPRSIRFGRGKGRTGFAKR